MLPPRITLVTLGVEDVGRATAFYEALGWRRSAASTPEVSFFHTGGAVLALWGRDDLTDDARLPRGTGAPGAVALAVNVESPAAVDAALSAAEAAGATILKPAEPTPWGGYQGVFADPDWHPWEVAHNPGFPLRDDGTVQLPE